MTDDPETIEVGEIRGSGLRLWCAREALRQAEARVDGQMDALNRMITRATSGLGWNVTLSLALAAAVARGWSGAWVPLFGTGLAAICCVATLMPETWDVPGHSATWLLSVPYETEVEVIEDLALGAEAGAERNMVRLKRSVFWIRLMSGLMIAAAVSAAASTLV